MIPFEMKARGKNILFRLKNSKVNRYQFQSAETSPSGGRVVMEYSKSDADLGLQSLKGLLVFGFKASD